MIAFKQPRSSETVLELAFVLMALMSFASGLALRSYVSVKLSQTALALGIGFLLVGAAVLALKISGRAGNLGLLGAILPVLSFTLSSLALPFGLATGWGRPSKEQ